MAEPGYDSTADTLKHSQRVGELMTQPIRELVDRSVCHDRSKTEDPELAVFNEFTPKLAGTTYGSEEYKGYLAAMGEGLAHHYVSNRHHPEHFADGIGGMTLVDLVEMLADWRAASERHDDGSLVRSLAIQQERFAISEQLAAILRNTAEHFGWLDQLDGAPPRFITRTNAVNAVRWMGDNEAEITALVGTDFYAVHPDDREDPEASGALLASEHSAWEDVYPGVWIVRDGYGRVRQLGAEEFARTYQEAP